MGEGEGGLVDFRVGGFSCMVFLSRGLIDLGLLNSITVLSHSFEQRDGS